MTAQDPVRPKTCIILVNWNGWRHTLKCLVSLLEITDSLFEIVICDNDSTDNSLGQIQSSLARHFIISHLNKPYSKCNLGTFAVENTTSQFLLSGHTLPNGIEQRITFIKASSNKGFGGGNNIGIRYALSAEAPDYIWLLNNDTIVEPGALSAMIARMRSVPRAGVCGCTLLQLDAPDRIQSLGGSRYLKWAGAGVPLGAGKSWPLDVRPETVEKELSYVAGASMLVSRDFIDTVGPMEERYFLYFEEMDWVLRARGRFKIVYAPDAIVYHQEGGAIGSSGTGRTRSPRSFFWLGRSRLMFTLRHFPVAVPSVVLFSLVNCFQWALMNRNPHILAEGLAGLASGLVASLRGRGVP